jgi:hypothetical protein
MPQRSWFTPHAYFMRHRNAFRTTSVMQRLRENLGEEQKALAELDYLIFMKLFHPMQTARCMLSAYPHHCDVLSLLNALVTGQGDQRQCSDDAVNKEMSVGVPVSGGLGT